MSVELPREPDRNAPLFFISHATARAPAEISPAREPNEPFLQFFTDLSENVSQLVYRPPGSDPGFIDRTIGAGRAWEQEILGAVGTCQVFIGLLSEPYFHSEWCGKEWDAFTRRQTLRRPDGADAPAHCTLPVLWAPVRDDAIPGVVRAHQMFAPRQPETPGFAKRYMSEGIYGLLRTNKEDYTTTVWRIAQDISSLLNSYWVAPSVFPEAVQLRNVFKMEET